MNLERHSPSDPTSVTDASATSAASAKLQDTPSFYWDSETTMAVPDYENRLSNELWALVFEHVSKKQKSLRLVSRKFNSFSISRIYRKFRLTPKLLDQSDPVTARIVDHFRRITRYVLINQKLDWDTAVDALSECKAFQDLSWWFFPENPCSFPPQFQTAICTKWAHVRVHIVIPIELSLNGLVRPISTSSIPTANLSSLRIDTDVYDEDFENLLLPAKRLQKLDVFGRIKKTRLPTGSKLPPLRELTFEYDSDTMACIWDVSKLQSLTVDGPGFLLSHTDESTNAFPVLKRLLISGRPGSAPEVKRQLTTIIEKLNPLEELELAFDLDLINVLTAIIKHASTLNILRIDDVPFPSQLALQTRTAHFKRIQESCVHLSNLEITIGDSTDAESGEEITSPPVELLASFTNLRFLRVNIRTQDAKVLWNTGFHVKFKDNLRLRKCGARFSVLCFSVTSDLRPFATIAGRFFGTAIYEYTDDGTEICPEYYASD